MTNPVAVLFDLDGTLLDTIEDLTDSMNAVLAAVGAPLHPPEAYKHFIGDGVEMLVRRALPAECRDDEFVTKSVLEMRREYANRWHVKTRPYPGVEEMLDALTARRVPLAILSNKPHDFTEKIVERFLASWPFAPVLGARPDVAKKPDPTAALEISASLGIQPTNWLYLGDSGVDMRTAVAAGMHPVGVCWGFREADELRRDGAQILIERPEQLLELLLGV